MRIVFSSNDILEGHSASAVSSWVTGWAAIFNSFCSGSAKPVASARQEFDGSEIWVSGGWELVLIILLLICGLARHAARGLL